MNAINPKVDLYLADGCGRCKYHATPKCKVKTWQNELETLRQVVLDSGLLVEDLKWGVPVYTVNGKNILSVSAFKEYACISFFKGVLLNDTNGIFEKHGENSQSMRIIKFTNADDIVKLEPILHAYIKEAIAVEESGAKVEFKKNLEPTPDELLAKFEEVPVFKNAFYALTPGKQRAYIIYFSQPKQSQSRINRIESKMQAILNGEGLHDKYRK